MELREEQSALPSPTATPIEPAQLSQPSILEDGTKAFQRRVQTRVEVLGN